MSAAQRARRLTSVAGTPLQILSLLLLLTSVGVIRAAAVSKRQAVNRESQLWPKRLIPYRYVYSFTARERKNILNAMKEWEMFTCLRFKEVAPESQIHAARLVRSEAGCFSSTGYEPDGDQSINLGEDCMDPDIVLHELGHTIGLLHEQERTNRNQFVDVDPKRIKSAYIDQFSQPKEQKDFGLPYSYRSIMHYGKDFFNKKGKISILARDTKFTDIIGNARHLAFKDAWIVNKMYKCAGHCQESSPCPPGGFRGKNCRCWCPSVEYTAVDCVTGRAVDPSRVVPKSGRVINNENSGNVFFWSEHEVDWFEARDNCRSMGGSLVDFQYSDTLPDIENNIATLVDQGYDPEGKYKSSFIWTGGNDIAQEGTFRWLDGTPVSLSDLSMSRGEPNNGGGLNDDCLAIFAQSGSEFADWDCGKNLRYICRLDSASCHDLTPTCAYYKRVGLCSNTSLAVKCRRTCGGCSVMKRRPAKLSPAPVGQDTEDGPSFR